MSFAGRMQYYRRIFSAYVLPRESQLTFWHDNPQANPNAVIDQVGEYYMLFSDKADYQGKHDSSGVPMLDYHGRIGLQHNPIAIAQWGLGNHDLFRRTGSSDRKNKFVAASDWLCAGLEKNSCGVFVWNHYFDWEYRTVLKAPWYSGLAQGQGISLLVRAHAVTGKNAYLDAAALAFASFLKSTSEGGVTFTDERGNPWLEEYIVSPPTHILNGFIWALWGLWDYFLATQDALARELFMKAVETVKANIDRYDLGFWSLYEVAGTRLPMVASFFYHRLHIVQLRIMHLLTGDQIFTTYADRWETYTHSRASRIRALLYKSAFKLCYY